MSVSPYQELNFPLIKQEPHSALELVVTIPCFREDNILRSLHALRTASTSNYVEIIILINEPEQTEESSSLLNQACYKQCLDFKSEFEQSHFKIYPIYIHKIPTKISGVGLARKLAMDEACSRLVGVNNGQRIIVGFDADSICRVNFFEAVLSHFNNNPKSPGASIHFEHPIVGEEFEEEVYDAICLYESHLRYFIQFQKWLGLPFAFQTIGSSMAVRANAYRKIGGMNKRKAGEDFYFLQKLIKLEGFTEIKTTKIIPSPRKSTRVPFGTGKAVKDMLESESSFMSYAPQSFLDLSMLLKVKENMFGLEVEELESLFSEFPKPLSDFFQESNAAHYIHSISKNSKTYNSFNKKLFQWFDAFKLMKYLHFARDHSYPNMTLDEIFKWYFPEILNISDPKNPGLRLRELRKVDLRPGNWINEEQV